MSFAGSINLSIREVYPHDIKARIIGQAIILFFEKTCDYYEVFTFSAKMDHYRRAIGDTVF